MRSLRLLSFAAALLLVMAYCVGRSSAAMAAFARGSGSPEGVIFAQARDTSNGAHAQGKPVSAYLSGASSRQVVPSGSYSPLGPAIYCAVDGIDRAPVAFLTGNFAVSEAQLRALATNTADAFGQEARARCTGPGPFSLRELRQCARGEWLMRVDNLVRFFDLGDVELYGRTYAQAFCSSTIRNGRGEVVGVRGHGPCIDAILIKVNWALAPACPETVPCR